MTGDGVNVLRCPGSGALLLWVSSEGLHPEVVPLAPGPGFPRMSLIRPHIPVLLTDPVSPGGHFHEHDQSIYQCVPYGGARQMVAVDLCRQGEEPFPSALTHKVEQLRAK